MVLRAAALALALTGCASLDRAECLSGDWRGIGVADGAEGRGPSRLEEHRAACEGTGAAIDAAAWEAGRREGLALHCTPRNAWRAGVRGAALSSACPAEDTAALQEAWRRGRERFLIQREIVELQSRLWYPRYGAYGWRWGDAMIHQARVAQLRAQLGALPPPPE